MARSVAFAAALAWLLCVGCGGSKSSGPQDNRAPVANAGTDQSVPPGAAVQLDGSGSRDPDGDALSYAWTAPSGVALSTATVARPTFTAGAAGPYRFALVVSDGTLVSAPDEVVVTVRPANRAPVAAAGPDQSVAVGATVQLDGTGSADPDGDALRYAWTAPASVSLTTTTGARPAFLAGGAGTYRLALVVSDGALDSAPDEVVITVQPAAPADTTFSLVNSQVLARSCALSGCHAGATSPYLGAGQAWANLVNQPGGAGMPLVTPGDPGQSYLYVKITGGAGMLGSRMPLSRPALGSSDLAVVRAWILRGAPND
jgi:hypothetical protein